MANLRDLFESIETEGTASEARGMAAVEAWAETVTDELAESKSVAATMVQTFKAMTETAEAQNETIRELVRRVSALERAPRDQSW